MKSLVLLGFSFFTLAQGSEVPQCGETEVTYSPLAAGDTRAVGKLKFLMLRFYEPNRNGGFARYAVHLDHQTNPYGGPITPYQLNDSAEIELELAPGQHSFSISRATSSHTGYLSRDALVEFKAGYKANAMFYGCPGSFVLTAHAQTAVGEALYVTGEQVGSWKTARRLTPATLSSGEQVWELNFPTDSIATGSSIKILRGPWSESLQAQTIDSSFVWQSGPNVVIQKFDTTNFPFVRAHVTPVFE